ncbi:hypothetical protein [Allofournierella massiliensis]|uniref:Uncharacterized protein n=1 Tax=Allofournierella massiliensis TaxID=1650663 RepID=A0A4R1QK92_9FIRM|nr:hypothetical protein [Fournierella massiliensis]TCL54069.1 hypothetical protein EDD77_12433 [Fournierella massiliensis]
MNKRMKKSLWALVGTMLCGCLLLAPGARAAETTALEDALEQTARLHQLAEEYAAGQQTETEPLTLTINYIRAQRYADTTWDMILGEPSEEFAGFVEQQAPELAQLQTLENVEIPATGEPVDFVHLVAGIGATWKRLPVVCTWGGDCIQLAGSVQGSGMDEESCIQQLKPYFACEDENASLLPKSDWLADLDGVNIGSTLTQDSDLAESIREYYRSISTGERARRFVLAQFGEVDTGDQQAFRQQVKDKFFSDSGVQLLLLSQKQMTLDEERNFVVVDSLNAPLNAVCSLTADTLAEMLDGAKVTGAAEETPQETGETQSPAQTSQPGEAQPTAPVLGQSSLARTMEKYSWLPWALGGVVLFCVLVLAVLSRKSR